MFSFMYLIEGSVHVLIDFSLTVKAATLIFISRRGSAISSAKVVSKMHSNVAILCFLMIR